MGVLVRGGGGLDLTDNRQASTVQQSNLVAHCVSVCIVVKNCC